VSRFLTALTAPECQRPLQNLRGSYVSTACWPRWPGSALCGRSEAVLEIRHPSWLTPPVCEQLRRAGVALCLRDWPEAPVADVLTADFVDIRRHGPSKCYGSRYTDAALGAEADRIRRWLERGHDVYVYFNNDARAHTVDNALGLMRLLGPGRQAA